MDLWWYASNPFYPSIPVCFPHYQLRAEDLFTRLRVRDALSKAPAKLLIAHSDHLAECISDPDPFIRRTSLSILSRLPSSALVPFIDLIVIRLEDPGKILILDDL